MSEAADNELPPGWIVEPAARVCLKIQDGTHFSPKVQLAAGPYMYVTAKNVRPHGLDLRDVTYLCEEDHRNIYARCAVREGDVLLVKDGVNAGDAAVNTLRVEISLLSSVCFLRPVPDRLKPGFLRYYLQSPQAVFALQGSLSGTAIRRIVLNRVRDLPVVVAPLAEQDRVVAEIEKHFTRLDEAVATLKAVQAKLKRARASVLKAAVEGRLVPTEAELARAEDRSYEPASVLLERILAERRTRWPKGKKYQPPAEPNTNDLPALPEGWAWATLGATTDVVGGLTKNKRTEQGREVPYLRVANVQRGHLDLTHVKSIVATEAMIADLRLVPGDILLNEGGDRDKLGRGWVWEGQIPECIHQNHVFRARVWLPSLQAKYVSHYANSMGQAYFLGQGKQTTNLASISLSKIKLLPLAVPPAAEQTRIVAEVERRLSVIDNLERTVEQNLARCGRLRQSILKRAFEGKLVPQDPADEPASVLLARIRAQRAAEARA